MVFGCFTSNNPITLSDVCIKLLSKSRCTLVEYKLMEFALGETACTVLVF